MAQHEWASLFVRRHVDEKEEQLVRDCKKGMTDKNGRTSNLPKIWKDGDYLYIRVTKKVIPRWQLRKSVTYKFCEALGFNMDTFYESKVYFDKKSGKAYPTYVESKIKIK